MRFAPEYAFPFCEPVAVVLSDEGVAEDVIEGVRCPHESRNEDSCRMGCYGCDGVSETLGPEQAHPDEVSVSVVPSEEGVLAWRTSPDIYTRYVNSNTPHDKTKAPAPFHTQFITPR